MAFIYLKRLWLLLLILCTGASLLPGRPLFTGRGDLFYASYRGLTNYFLDDIPLELIYAGASPLLFQNNIFNAISQDNGVAFYLPLQSHLIENSITGVEMSDGYENYFFALNKKGSGFLADYYTGLPVKRGNWKGSHYTAHIKGEKTRLMFFLSDHELLHDEGMSEFVYSLLHFETSLGSWAFSGKREFLENTDGLSTALYQGGVKWKDISVQGQAVPEQSLFRIAADYTLTLGKNELTLSPFVFDKIFDMNAVLRHGVFYVEKKTRHDWVGPFEVSYYETGIAEPDWGQFFIRYADHMSHPLYEYENTVLPGAAFQIPVRAGDSLMLLAEADLLITQKQNSMLRNSVVGTFSFFQGDLMLTAFLRNTILTPTETLDGSFYYDFFLAVALVNTELSLTAENIFNQKITVSDEYEINERKITFDVRWFFYN